ncbi:MAG: hypothetical protein WCY08_04110 [Rhodocyclaceae bacterium]
MYEKNHPLTSQPRLHSRAGVRLIGASLLALCLAGAAHADPKSDPFPDADHFEGERMHGEMCVECHGRNFGGEGGSDIYTRSDRRVSSPDSLQQQLTACTAMLNLDLFPEDEYHIAGFLNKHFYRFE